MGVANFGPVSLKVIITTPWRPAMKNKEFQKTITDRDDFFELFEKNIINRRKT